MSIVARTPPRFHPLSGPLLLATLVWLVGAEGTARAKGIPEPDNVLLITLDTLRADHLGVYGRRPSITPTLDRLAAEGTVFLDATCSMPTTLPSHLTLFTGLAPEQHGVWLNGVVPRPELRSVFEELEAGGRRTAAVVAARVLEARYLAGLGFGEILDDGLGSERHQLPGEAIVERAETWLATVGEEERFALWLHFFDPHEPYDPEPAIAAPWVEDYDGPLGDSLGIDELLALNEPQRQDDLSAEDRQHVSDLYAAEVVELDRHLGRLLEVLEGRDLLERTLIVVVADHGQALGEQGHWGHGEWLLESIIKVPWIVRGPGVRVGRRVKTPVEAADLAPTLAQVFGFELPSDRRGRSLVPALAGRRIPDSGPRVVLRRRYPQEPRRFGITVLEGPLKWLYVRDSTGQHYRLGRRDGDGGLDGEDFFDPYDPAAREFHRRARDLDVPTQDPLLDAETLEMLRSLGYVQ